MKSLTNNQFKFGAISQKIIRQVWRKNNLITYDAFSKLWIKENSKGISYPELAYNEFMKTYGDKDKWFHNKKVILKVFKKYDML